MQCPNCGFDNRPDARFCKQCGYALTSLAPSSPAAPSPASALPPTVCPHCGAPLKAGARFCSRCGQAVQETTAVSPAPSPPYTAPQAVPPPAMPAAVAPPPSGTKPGLVMGASTPTRPRRRFPWLWLLIGGVVILGIIAVLVVLFIIRPGKEKAPVATPTPTLTVPPPAATTELVASPEPTATLSPQPAAPLVMEAEDNHVRVTLALSAASLPVTEGLTATVTITNLTTVALNNVTCELLGPLAPALSATTEATLAEIPAGSTGVITFAAAAPLTAGEFPLQAVVTFLVQETTPYRDGLLTGPLTVTVTE